MSESPQSKQEERERIHDTPSVLVPERRPIAFDLVENVDGLEAMQPKGNTETHACGDRSVESREYQEEERRWGGYRS